MNFSADLYPVYDTDLRFGVNLACGDLDGDGKDEIITAPGPSPSSTAHIKAFRANGALFTAKGGKPASFYAYPQDVRYGARVAVGDVDGDGQLDIVTAPGPAPGSTAHIRIFTPAGGLKAQFYAYGVDMLRGGHLACGDLDGDGKDEIITAPGPAALSPALIPDHLT